MYAKITFAMIVYPNEDGAGGGVIIGTGFGGSRVHDVVVVGCGC